MLGGARKEREQDLERMLAEAQARIAQLEEELRGKAERDSVTGLATLDRFRTALELESGRARRHGRPVAVAVVDVDDFRALMARHGHATGDDVLREVARVLDQETRATDTACRAGGDEFAVLMPETDLPGAAAFAERMVLALEKTRAGAVEGIRVSVGIATYDRAKGPNETLGAAYAALDHSRKLGGGRVTAGPEFDGAETADDAEKRDAVSALAVTLLERDRYTGEHSESVLAMVEKVAHGLGLDQDEVDRIKAAALLHDIGKVAIPDAILNKAGPLNDEEWKLMKDHTVVGERILRAIPGLGGVARIVRHEHERWDGTGYPDGIAGEEIPIGARIILACDAYHAMTSDRPYREAMPHGEAMKELTEGAGTQFDPAVVETLVGLLYSSRQTGAVEAAPREPAAA
jgi:diguanylate cyclase (GGDEF)-like protein/putative nucleotidyltransferase with HDIG domain